jgi:YD repeat-containing protein
MDVRTSSRRRALLRQLFSWGPRQVAWGATTQPSTRPAGIFVALTLLALALGAGAAEAAVTVTVTANPQWVNTGINVVAGKPLHVTATGAWRYRGGDPFFGPDGSGAYGHGWNHAAGDGALVAYISQNGLTTTDFYSIPASSRFFRIGSNFTGALPASGRLYLGFNADSGGTTLSDNEGSVVATISYSGSAPSLGAVLGKGHCVVGSICRFRKQTTRHRADPVNTATGSFYQEATDIELPGVGDDFRFSRTYNSMNAASTFGQGWTASHHDALAMNADGSVVFESDEGEQILFQPAGGGAFTPADPDVLATLSLSGGTYTLIRPDQDRYTFNAQGLLLTHRDEQGNTLRFTRDANGFLTSITDTAGRTLPVVTDANGRITTITLPDGRSVHYTFTGHLLTAVTDLAGATTQYQYDGTCSPRPGWRDVLAIGTLGARTCARYAADAPSRSRGSVTVPGVAIARRVASARYAAGSTPASFADSSRL